MVTGHAASRPAAAGGGWPRLPAAAAERLVAHLGWVAEEVADEVERRLPQVVLPQTAAGAPGVRQVVALATQEFGQRIADPGASCQRAARLFRDFGRAEAAARRNLEPLQAALRLGMRVAWRWLTRQEVCAVLGAEVLAPVGEALLLYLDELASACADGYAEAAWAEAGDTERRRRLLGLIVRDPPGDLSAVAELARLSGWRLPRRVAALALQPPPGEPGSRPALPPDALADLAGPQPCALVPDPDGPGRWKTIERGLRGWPAAIGPAVPLERAGASLRWARRALSLAARGIVRPADGIIRCSRQLSAMVLFADEDLLRTLTVVRLSPLKALRPAQQDALAETLLRWLQCGGNASEVARHLHVHPQTARYRIRQLHRLFGDALTDPDARFELEMALRARWMTVGRDGVPPAAAEGLPN